MLPKAVDFRPSKIRGPILFETTDSRETAQKTWISSCFLWPTWYDTSILSRPKVITPSQLRTRSREEIRTGPDISQQKTARTVGKKATPIRSFSRKTREIKSNNRLSGRLHETTASQTAYQVYTVLKHGLTLVVLQILSDSEFKYRTCVGVDRPRNAGAFVRIQSMQPGLVHVRNKMEEV